MEAQKFMQPDFAYFIFVFININKKETECKSENISNFRVSTI